MMRLPWWLSVLVLMVGCASFDPWFDYAPDDPRLQLIGRMDMSPEDGPIYAYSGVTIRFRCNCTAVDVDFKDLGNDSGLGGDEHTNYVNIIVDGKEAAKVEVQTIANILHGVSGLKRGEHTIEVVKRTEAFAGNLQFLGISLQGVLLDPPPRAERHMEFIGDSITCGYGDEVNINATPPDYTEPNTGYHSKNEDISKAFGSLVGREFDAEVVTTCISGTGVYRNIDGSTGDKAFPALYQRIFPTQEKPLWATELYTPDLIVINLGNNDFSVPDDSGVPSVPDRVAFEAAYTAFIKTLRSDYPDARIIATVGPLANDNYPAGGNHWTLMQQYVSEVVQGLRESDPNVYYFAYTPLAGNPYGEDWHPTAGAHAQMAQELSDYLHGLDD